MADPSLHSEFGEALTNMMKEVLKKDARSDHADMHAEDLETQKRKEMKEALEAKVVMSAEAQEVLKNYAATGEVLESDKEALNRRRARVFQEHFFLKRKHDMLEMVDAQGRYYCTVCAIWMPDEASWQQHLQSEWHAQRRTLHRTWAREAIEALEEKEALGAHEIEALKNVAARVELSEADQEALRQRRERLFYEHYFMKQDEDLCAKGLWMDAIKVPEPLLEMEQ